MTDSIQQDAPCPCGSGAEYSNCCGYDQEAWHWDDTPAMDVYFMVDADAVRTRLSRQPDVAGEAACWVRIQQIPGGFRSLAVLTSTEDQLLIVRTASDEVADQTYEWLKEICSGSLLTEDGNVMRMGSVSASALPREDSVH